MGRDFGSLILTHAAHDELLYNMTGSRLSGSQLQRSVQSAGDVNAVDHRIPRVSVIFGPDLGVILL